jgi:hypothetical protein
LVIPAAIKILPVAHSIAFCLLPVDSFVTTSLSKVCGAFFVAWHNPYLNAFNVGDKSINTCEKHLY